MTLDFDNIGGIRIVPHGGGSAVTYGIPDNLDVLSPSGSVRISVGRTTPGVSWVMGMLVPGYRDAARPLLDVGGKVYLNGCKILDPGTGESFSDGGYLGTINMTWRYVDPTRTPALDETWTVPILGVIPAQYAGGVKIDNLTVPVGAMANWPAVPHGFIRGEIPIGFHANGDSIRFWNWRMEDWNSYEQSNNTLSGRFCGGIGIDCWYQILGS